MAINPRVFREYDIRGVADRDFPDEVAARLGRAIGDHLAEGGARRVTLGRDGRLSSPRIHATVRAALLAAGLDVLDVGILHSPGLYFSVFHLDADGGVMITASHNPAEDNGFKILAGRSTIHSEEIQRLRARVESGAVRTPARTGAASDHDVLSAYVATVAGNIRLGSRPVKVVVDGGNGTGGLALLPILDRLGVNADAMYCDLDGRFPHHPPDPTVADNLVDLARRVYDTGAEVGIALDGDADRLGAIDGHGRVLWGDQLVILFARQILAERPGAAFVSEVKCSRALFDDIAARGGRAVMWKVGHSLIKVKMKEEQAALAGEMSGHMFFADRWYGFDDAVYAGARLVELLSQSPHTLAELYETLPVFHNTPELRMPCPDDVKFEVVRRAVAWFRARFQVIELDGVRVTFDDADGNTTGWGLVRASNTGPMLVMRFEADTAARLHEIRALVEAQMQTLIGEVAAEQPARV